MKLKILREHFFTKDGTTWMPKKSFKTEKEIKEQTGFDPDKCNIYTCSICDNLHTASYPNTNRKKVKR